MAREEDLISFINVLIQYHPGPLFVSVIQQERNVVGEKDK